MSATERRRQAWAYLSRVVEAPSVGLHVLIAGRGPEHAARAVRERAVSPPLLTSTQARHQLDCAADDLALVTSLGGRLVTPDDDEWPTWRMVGYAGEEGVNPRTPVRPVALWVLGRARLDEVTERAVSVVGTRAISGYGEHVTAELCHDLAADGWTVISGAAYGVDGAAHRAALGASGPTVAVLACGVDRAYPAGHQALLRRVAVDGLVVSEYPPGTLPARHRFLHRNRLIAGLGEGVVVVEAGWRSGARSTATWAGTLGRAVMAVPGPVTSLGSTGCHRMIREHEADLVASAAEVVERVGRIGELAPEPDTPMRPLDGLDPTLAQVHGALPGRGSCGEQRISESSGVPLTRVRAALALLELEHLATLTEQGWARARHSGGGA